MCLHPGGRKGQVRRYLAPRDPGSDEFIVPPLRTNESYKEALKMLEVAASQRKSGPSQTPPHHQGIRGQSRLINSLECGILGVCLDIMHLKDEV